MFRARRTPRCLNTQSVNAKASSSLPDLLDLGAESGSFEVDKGCCCLLLALVSFNRAEEEIVAEEVQRANETDACVVTSLKDGDQQGAFADRARILDID